jgi:deoxyribonuclease I
MIKSVIKIKTLCMYKYNHGDTMIKLLIILTMLSTSAIAQNLTIDSFSKAKRHLKKIYSKTSLKKKSFYCDCNFDLKKKKVDHNSCGYKGSKYKKRSHRIEWEHVADAHHLVLASKYRGMWVKGHPSCKGKRGRKCASKNIYVSRMLSDIRNLLPAVGSINAYRSDKQFTEIPGSSKIFGRCGISFEGRKAMPPADKKGDVARIYFYMQDTYKLNLISDKNMRIFKAWNKQDPVDREECLREKISSQIQGGRNPFVGNFCK